MTKRDWEWEVVRSSNQAGCPTFGGPGKYMVVAALSSQFRSSVQIFSTCTLRNHVCAKIISV